MSNLAATIISNLIAVGFGFALGWAAKRDRHYPPGYTWRVRRIDRARRKLDRLTS